MGKENDILCRYLDNRERFADLFYAAFFNGRPEVKPEELTEASEVYTGIMKGYKTFSRTRDIKKRLRNGIALKVLAMEAQGHTDYTMPWRCMNYDNHEYEKQLDMLRQRNRQRGQYSSSAERLCQVRKTDRIFPIYTLCLYHGTEPWDGPRSSRDMMDFGQDRGSWERWFADYPANVVCMNEWKDYSLFRTPLREVFRMLPFRKDKAGLLSLLKKHPEYAALDEETALTLGGLMGVDKFMDNHEAYREENTYNMCQALRDMMEDSRENGRLEGEDFFARLAEKLLKASRTEDLSKAVCDKEFRSALYQEFGIKE